MPSTLGSLQLDVQNLLKRAQFFDPLGNDVTPAALLMFVNNALLTMQRRLVVRDAETTQSVVIGPTTGNYPYPIPTLAPPYRHTNDLWLQGQRKPLHRYITVREFHTDYPPSIPPPTGAAPMGYCIYDGTLNLGPAPVTDWTYYWDYVAWLPALSQTTDHNWYTDNADDAVRYFACREAAVWLMEDALAKFYNDLGEKALDETRKSIRTEEVAEGYLTARLYG